MAQAVFITHSINKGVRDRRLDCGVEAAG